MISADQFQKQQALWSFMKTCWDCAKHYDTPELYEVAKQTCHTAGLPWTDPRTGITHLPPKTPKRK